MSRPLGPTSRQQDDAATAPYLRRRHFMAAGAGAGATLLAGCTAGTKTSDVTGDGRPSTASDGPSAATGTFRLLISDLPVAIGDFDALDVSFDRARLFRADRDDEAAGGTPPGAEAETDTATATATATETATGTETATATSTATGTETATATSTATGTETATATPTATGTETTTQTETATPTATATAVGASTETEPGEAANEADDGGQRGFFVIDLGGATVDLTEVVGDRAIGVFEGSLEAGRYAKVELYAAGVEGIVDGEPVDVTIPSGKLQIVRPFEVVAGETLRFVFDINVVKKGQSDEYNLLPVISESGVAGEDVEVEEVGNAEAKPDSDGTEAPETERAEPEEDPDAPPDDDGRGNGAGGGEDGGPPDGVRGAP